MPPGTRTVPGGCPHWWQRRAIRASALSVLLALSGLVILALVREQTGTEGFLVGLGLSVLPVPLLIASFRWLDRVDPGPWRILLFAFSWGACAAALIAIVANSFATHWIATATADPSRAGTWGTTVIAPVVEESAKATAVLLVFLFRRRHFAGVVDGAVIAGLSASGFAFTENVLYLGTAFGSDRLTGDSGLSSLTAATFFVRIVMSPFAHPLFTVLTGIGFGLAAASARSLPRRLLPPAAGLLLAMGLHAAWNSSPKLGDYGFVAVYAALMVPVFAVVTWLVVWTRQRELRTVRTELPAYTRAGWLGPQEPWALGSMRARRLARDRARHTPGGGRPAARTVSEYEAYATSLAFLRHRTRRAGRPGPDYAARERALLHELWSRRAVAGPALEYAARAAAPVPVPPWGPWPAWDPRTAPHPHLNPYAHPSPLPYQHPYPNPYAQPPAPQRYPGGAGTGGA
ncbi:PrsW family intramembrane metalloprotease [Streptomyces sp. NPDC058045]|uniref:PrsW family intramembrane metalloprotease n=1 Tax=Streptomyces sp. NPDC058045 TaxID=3346311 RepID=UPI0036EC01D5